MGGTLITLLRPDPAWRQLLKQIGFPYGIGPPDTNSRVLIAPEQTGPDELATALADAPHECGLLTEGRICPSLPEARRPTVRLPFRVHDAMRVGKNAIRVFDGSTPRPVVERVAARDRGEVRHQVMEAVQRLLDEQSLPCVRLASSPGANQAVLGFRVDTEYCSYDQLIATRQLADDVGMSFTWFINTEAHGPWLGKLDLLLRGQDVQVHCHRHQVFRSVRANRENIAQAVSVMRAHGHQVAGAASPYGDWNPAWDKALGELGVAYSSDFTAGYDDLPFRPLLDDRPSQVLQVPVHPVCVGRLSAAHAGNDMIARYLRTVVARQVNCREPCLLYDHPTGIATHHKLLLGVLKEAKEACGATMTLTELAHWWVRRERVEWSASVSTDEVEVSVTRGDTSVEVELESKGLWARMPVRHGRWPLAALTWLPAERRLRTRYFPVPLRTRLSEAVRRFRRQKRV